MIGIGVTTCNRPEYLDLCISQVQKFTPSHKLYIHDDTHERNGVAYAKNSCLYNLKDCDLIILFDDDCFPKHPDWLPLFEKAHKETRQNHFLYMGRDVHDFQGTWTDIPDWSIDIYGNCAGCFMTITKKAFEAVGYFDSRYKRYGYEHAGFSRRVHAARLNAAPFMCVNGTNKLIHSIDIDGVADYGLTRSITLTEEEKSEFMPHNESTYHNEIDRHYDIYRTFKP